MAFVQLDRVTKTYRKGEHVVTPLADVSLEIERGEFFVLLGPSGSGKSTLLNLLAGIDRVDQGTIRIGGEDITALRGGRLADWRARQVGYVFQHHNLVPVLTAYENVELPLGLLSLSKRERHDRVSLALSAVGLADRWHHRPNQLSGGQEQRVAIARAFVGDPPLIVADEPTGNLDEASAEAALDLLQRFNRERGTTVVMVTHDPKAASRGTRAMRLDKGHLQPLTEVNS